MFLSPPLWMEVILSDNVIKYNWNEYNQIHTFKTIHSQFKKKSFSKLFLLCHTICLTGSTNYMCYNGTHIIGSSNSFESWPVIVFIVYVFVFIFTFNLYKATIALPQTWLNKLKLIVPSAPPSLLLVAHIDMKLDIKCFQEDWPTYAP